MQIQSESLSPTKVKLTITAEPKELNQLKQRSLTSLSGSVKVPGFRAGKAPAALVEKQIDPAQLQSQFLDDAVNELYITAINKRKVRVVAQPQISVIKFVPFTTLEFSAEVDAISEIKLANYKNVKLLPRPTKVTAEEIKKVMEDLQGRLSTKNSVQRAAKNGDEAVIDFKGTDPLTKQPIANADGSDYPLTLGSDSFIPGFEKQLIGLKPGETKDFIITFPKDYQAQDLRSKKVRFEVTVKTINELVKPKVDNKFAASIGSFKTVEALKSDIKRELAEQKKKQAGQEQDNAMLESLATKSTIAIPDSLINDEIDRMEEEERRNLTYRGQTWQEHLDQEGVSAEQHRERQKPSAELRIKAGVILGEVAEAEGIKVTPEELDLRIKLLKGQYATDQRMQDELDTPEGKRDIRSRMLTEKTIDKLRSFAKSTKAKA